MTLPSDYVERVYAGVLGKIIGVYLGRPFEGWTHERILQELGPVQYYVHERLGKPLVVTDDDITGTFTFLRALPDYGNSLDLTPEQIGQTWLNYLIEKRTILWWGGLGHSTEHTAYLRLKHGVPAPRSGSIELNGEVVAEQIGAQIFIDGWGTVAAGDPERAADLARRAASVSHDGEAVYGAQVVAAMEAQAFVERDINRLLDTAVSLIPDDSIIYRLITDLRIWHAEEPDDWQKTRERLAAKYGYHRYGGNCHMVPNHALIIHSLLHGGGDFQKSLMIVNTCGWDTDCNSGNVGCLLGIRGGLAAINDGPDWRGPVADRMFLPTADGGRAITDAVRETYEIVNIGRALNGEPPLAPKNGARYHFSLPGSVQGFRPEESPECRGVASVANARDTADASNGILQILYRKLAPGRAARVATATFIPPDMQQSTGYTLIASPTLYPSQTVRARLEALRDFEHAKHTIVVRLYARYYNERDELTAIFGPEHRLENGEKADLEWIIPDLGGFPIAEIGLEIRADRSVWGVLALDYLTWDGIPDVRLTRTDGGTLWKRAWVDGVDHFESTPAEPLRLIQDEGTGLISQGTRDWTDYRAEAQITPHLSEEAGLAVRVQGMRRFYALLLARGGTARLVKALHDTEVLAEAPFPWQFGDTHHLALEVEGDHIRAFVDGAPLFQVQDAQDVLRGGAVGLVIREGRMAADAVTVRPLR